MLVSGLGVLEGHSLRYRGASPPPSHMRKLRPGEGWPWQGTWLERFGGQGWVDTASGQVCGGWPEARQRREAAVTRGRGRLWQGARMGPPPAPPGRGGARCYRALASTTPSGWSLFCPMLWDSGLILFGHQCPSGPKQGRPKGRAVAPPRAMAFNG